MRVGNGDNPSYATRQHGSSNSDRAATLPNSLMARILQKSSMQDTAQSGEDSNEDENLQSTEYSWAEEKVNISRISAAKSELCPSQNMMLKYDEMKRENSELRVELKQAYDTIARLEHDVQNRNTNREMQLEEELTRLQKQFEKEQDEMKEFEQMVEMFEQKMAELKSENTELRAKLHKAASKSESNSSSDSMIIENLSMHVYDLKNYLQNQFCTKTIFNDWRRNSSVNSRGEKCQVLRRQVDHEREKLNALEEELHKQQDRFQNMLDSEQSQAAILAQRLLEAESERESRRREQEKLEEKVIQLEQELQLIQHQEQGVSHDDNRHKTFELQNQVFALELVCREVQKKTQRWKDTSIRGALKYRNSVANMKCLTSWKFHSLMQVSLQEKVWKESHIKMKRKLSRILLSWFHEACFHRKKQSGHVERDVEELRGLLDEERLRSGFLSESVKRLQEREVRLKERIELLSLERDSLLLASSRASLVGDALKEARELVPQLLIELGGIKLDLDKVTVKLALTDEEMLAWTARIHVNMTTEGANDLVEKTLEGLELRGACDSTACHSLKVVSHKLAEAEQENAKLKRQLAKANTLLSNMHRLAGSFNMPVEGRQSIDTLLDESFSSFSPIDKCLWVLKVLENQVKLVVADWDASSSQEEVRLLQEELVKRKRQHEKESATRLAAIDSLSSSLTALRSEKAFLQNLVDGMDVKRALEQMMQSFESYVNSLLSKYSRRQLEYEKLEKHVENLTKIPSIGHCIHCDPSSEIERHSPNPVEGIGDTNLDVLRLTEVNRSYETQMESWKHFSKQLARQTFSLNLALNSSQIQTEVLYKELQNKDDHISNLFLQVQELIAKLGICDSERNNLIEQIAVMNNEKKCQQKAREGEDLSDNLEGVKLEFEFERKKLTALYEKSNREHRELKLRYDEMDIMLQKVTEEMERMSLENGNKLKKILSSRTSTTKLVQELIREIALCMESVGNFAYFTRQQEEHDLKQQKTIDMVLNALEAGVQNSSTLFSALASHLQMLKSENLGIKSEIKAKEGNHTKCNVQIKKYIELLEMSATRVEGELDDAMHECSKKVTETSQLFGLVNKQALEIQKMSQVKQEHARALQEVEKELEASRARVDSLCSQLDKLREELEGSRALLDSESANTKRLAECLQHSQEERQEVIARLEAEKQALVEKLADLTGKFNNQCEELEKEKSLRQQSAHNLSKMNEETKSLLQDLELSELEISRLQSSVRDAQAQNQHLANQIDKLMIDAARSDEALTEVRGNKSMLEQRCKQLEQQFEVIAKNASESNVELSQKLESADVRSSRLEKENLYLKERIQGVKAQLEGSQLQKQRLEAALALSQRSIVDLTVQHGHMLEALQLRDRTVAFLELRVREARAAARDARDQLRAVQRQLKSKEALIADLRAGTSEGHARLHSMEVALLATTELMELSLKAARREQAEGVWGCMRTRATCSLVWQAVRETKEEATRIQSDYSELISAKLLEEQEKEEQARQVSRLNGIVAELERDKHKSSETAGVYQRQVMEWKQAYEELYAEKERVKLSGLDAQAQLETEHAEKLEAQALCLQLRKEIQGRTEQVASRNELLAGVTSELEAKSSQLQDCQARLDECLRLLAEAEAKANRLKLREGQLLQTVKGAGELLVEETSIIYDSKNVLDKLKHEIVEYESYQAFVWKRLIDEKQSLHAGCMKLELDLKHKELVVQDQQDKLQALSARNSQVAEELALLYRRVEDYDALLLDKGHELAKLHGKVAEANALWRNAEQRLEAGKKLEEKLRRDVRAKEEEVRELQDQARGSRASSSLDSANNAPAREDKFALNSQLTGALEANDSLRETVRMQEEVIRELKANARYSKQLLMLEGSTAHGETLAAHRESFDQNPDQAEADLTRLHPSEAQVPLGLPRLLLQLLQEVALLVGEAEAWTARERSVEASSRKPSPSHEVMLEKQRRCVRLCERRQRRLTLRLALASLERHREHAQSGREGVQKFLMRVRNVQAMREKFQLRVGELERERETSKVEQLQLQKQIVEKTNMLLTTEKKCAQLIAWVNKYKPLVETNR
eukprot:764851-Hanusia_phi.AAC.1